MSTLAPALTNGFTGYSPFAAPPVTLEALSGNEPARALYVALGYGDYQLDPAAGHALFWQKKL